MSYTIVGWERPHPDPRKASSGTLTAAEVLKGLGQPAPNVHPAAWECPRCKTINAPHALRCECKP